MASTILGICNALATKMTTRAAVPNIRKCGYSDKEWTYQTQHTTEDCKCNFEQAADTMLGIIRRGGIPIMSWKEGQLRVVKFNCLKMRYVTVSYV
jgi:hypothetical protein